MTHRNYAIVFVAFVLLWSGSLAGFALTLQPLVGDLTRIGRLDEAHYGSNSGVRHFEPPLFEMTPKHLQHDVVVLGDSFSKDLKAGWQNYLAADLGAQIATFDGDAIMPEVLLADPAYRAHPPKVFVWQIVERNVQRVASRDAPCEVVAPASVRRLVKQPSSAKTRLVPRPLHSQLEESSISYAFDFISGAWMRKLGRSDPKVRIARLRRPLFSSTQSDQLLVLGDDWRKQHWTATDLARASCGLRQIQSAVEKDGKTSFLALLIPDKSSAYTDHLLDSPWSDTRVLDRLDLTGINAVPANQTLLAAIDAGTKDVYLPNDTHLGSKGYELVADIVAAELGRRGVLAN